MKSQHSSKEVPDARIVGSLGGKDAGINGRIKDFDVLGLDKSLNGIVVVTASSDGSVRLWQLSTKDPGSSPEGGKPQIGKLIGTHETGNRITCLRAFVMQPPREEDEGGLSEFEGLTSAAEESSESEEDG